MVFVFTELFELLESHNTCFIHFFFLDHYYCMIEFSPPINLLFIMTTPPLTEGTRKEKHKDHNNHNIPLSLPRVIQISQVRDIFINF